MSISLYERCPDNQAGYNSCFRCPSLAESLHMFLLFLIMEANSLFERNREGCSRMGMNSFCQVKSLCIHS